MKHLKIFNESRKNDIQELATDCFVEHDYIKFEINRNNISIYSVDEENFYIKFGVEKCSFFYDEIIDDFIKFSILLNDIIRIEHIDFHYYYSPMQTMDLSEVIDGVLPNDKYPALNRHIDNGKLEKITISI